MLACPYTSTHALYTIYKYMYMYIHVYMYMYMQRYTRPISN